MDNYKYFTGEDLGYKPGVVEQEGLLKRLKILKARMNSN